MSTDHALALLEKMIRAGASGRRKRSRSEFLPFVGPWPGVQGEELPQSIGGDCSPCRFEGYSGDVWAKDWGFYVSRHAMDALDIVYTTFIRTENAVDKEGRPVPLLDDSGAPVVENGRPQYKKITRHTAHWTQGSAFRFTRGMMIYDARIPDGEPWHESLQHIRRGILVLEARPATPAKDETDRNPGLVMSRKDHW